MLTAFTRPPGPALRPSTIAMTRTKSPPAQKTLPVSITDVRLPDTHNGLRVRFFYPCVPSPSTPTSAPKPPPTWFPNPPQTGSDPTVTAILRYTNLPLLPLLSPLLSPLARTPLPLHSNAPPSPGPHPLVLFSHGLAGSLANYTTFCASLSSLGYIVAAPEHTDGSAFLALPSTRRIPFIHYNPATHGPSLHFRADQLRVRRENFSDVQAALRSGAALLPLDDSLPPPNLTPALASDIPPLLAGHSFGAATALSYAAKKSPAVRSTLLLLDAWLEPLRNDIASYKLPNAHVLYIDQALSAMLGSIALRKTLPRPARADAVQILRGTHNHASDFPLYLPNFVTRLAGMHSPGADPRRLLELQNLATERFLAGRDEWVAFREELRRGGVDGLALAEMGEARAL